MLITAAIIIIIALAITAFINTARFGSLPKGERFQRIKRSKNYNGSNFTNQSFTPDLKEGISYLTVMRKFFFGKSKRSKPPTALPSVKTDLLNLPADNDVLVWFGHSSYFIRADGKTFLIDPVFSGNASPLNFTTKSFAGTDIYTSDDMPLIDYLVISHDHWDHLDYTTVLALKPKIKNIITGLGVAAHFERWNFDKHIIIEKDWDEEIELAPGFVINTVPGRHFSGRTFKRNQSLWLSFVLRTPTYKIFLGGDSGYDAHFKTIGENFGPFELAILECGQYNEYWKYIHMMPEEVVQAALDLKAKKFMPAHWAKFSLALHDWDEPVIRVMAESKRLNVPIITPMIGEAVDFKNDFVSKEWWALMSIPLMLTRRSGHVDPPWGRSIIVKNFCEVKDII